MKTESNEPVAPMIMEHFQQGLIGLTKREYFAGCFASGFASAGSTGMPQPEDLARYIVKATDALIEELNK